jgi:radical SAM superfamily enzyme with C-terminal helix-hairpin-helix motif
VERTTIRVAAPAALLILVATSAGPAFGQVGKPVTIADANAAKEQDLLALPHMTPELVKGLIEKRPFASQTDFDAYLATKLTPDQRKEVYGKAFVPLNLNSTTREEILMIPNAGNRMVREFLEYRPYKSLAQFHKEIGKYVDDKELARLEQYVFVPINLNTASDDAILSIPGLGRRMLREFKEYRPYKNMAQFRKEIGKYVDAKEVARLERYVTLD